GLEQLTALVEAASASWNQRPIDLKVHDGRASTLDRYRSQRALGATCSPARYAGNLAGMHDETAYLRELGVTVLHLSDVLIDARTVDPGIGSLARLADLAAALRLAGIALSLDLPAGPDPIADALALANLGVEVLRVDGDGDQIAVLAAV